MSDEWTISGGEPGSTFVVMMDIFKAQRVALDLAYRIRAVAQMLRAEGEQLSSPTGSQRALAYSSGLPATGSDLLECAAQAQRIDGGLLTMERALQVTGKAYFEAEQKAVNDRLKVSMSRDVGIPAGDLLSSAVRIGISVIVDYSRGATDLEGVGLGDVIGAAFMNESETLVNSVSAAFFAALNLNLRTLVLPNRQHTQRLTRLLANGSSVYALLFYDGIEVTEVDADEIQNFMPDPSTGQASDIVHGLVAIDRVVGVFPGVIEIRENLLNDGTRSFTVLIPGTQEIGSFGSSSNPNDMASNLDLMANGTSDSMTGVFMAMQEAGITADDPVVLMGHSQGGLIAAGLASNEQAREEFNVVAVTTFGAPVGNMQPDEGIQVLSLEHANDWIPSLDGKPNPVKQANWITAEIDFRKHDDPSVQALGYGWLGTHAMGTYAESFGMLMQQDSVLLDNWMEAAGVAFGPSVVETRSRHFQVKRTKEDPDPN